MNTEQSICLELQGLEVAFGSLKAIDNLWLSVPVGQRRAIIGPNGAGKTTLFNAIGGQRLPDQGKIFFAGQEITRLAPEERAGLGISRTYQISNLLGELTVRENLLLAMRGTRKGKFSLLLSARPTASEQQSLEQALAACAISQRETTIVKLLSYGEQRQLEIAMALVASPRLLLLDEPAAGLSPAERVRIAQLISELPRGLTLVMIEHDMRLALGLADYVTCLAAGQVLAEDQAGAIADNPLVQQAYLGGPC